MAIFNGLKNRLQDAGNAAKTFIKDNTGYDVDGFIQDAADSLKAATQDVNMESIRSTVQDAVSSTKSAVKSMMDNAASTGKYEYIEDEGTLNIQIISTFCAMKIIYYLMAADGAIFHSEEEKFDELGKELDPDFDENRETIIRSCQAQLDKVMEPEDYYDVLQDGVEDALMASRRTADSFITPKLLVWDLLTIAYSDEHYDEAERKLIKYIVRKTNIDKYVFIEMESSILTLMDIEREISWIKTTNRPYLAIEAMVNELADRKNVIFASIIDLITL